MGKLTNMTDTAVEQTGKKIIIPEGMPVRKAVEKLVEFDREQEREVRVTGNVEAHPHDVAYAFAKVIADTYGWVGLRATPGFFGDTPPQMISVNLGGGESVQVPWGRLAIPGIEGNISVGATQTDEGTYIGSVGGVVKRRDEEKLQELVTKTRAYVRENSIFKGRSWRMRFLDSAGDRIAVPEPRFLDLTGVDRDDLILPASAKRAIEDSLWTPIEFTEACRKHGAPLKRGILLRGPYGTGKTLTATVTAAIANQNGWTFIYVDSVEELPYAVRMAPWYGNVVIFAEDIDRVARRRDNKLQEIMNTVDGIDSKSSEIILVLTTNHADKIHEGLLRHGRIDDEIEIPRCDPDSAMALVRVYGRHLIRGDEDLTPVGERLDGLIPAAIREVVESAKYSAIRRSEGSMENFTISAEDLIRTADRVLANTVRAGIMRGEMTDEASELAATQQGGPATLVNK